MSDLNFKARGLDDGVAAVVSRPAGPEDTPRKLNVGIGHGTFIVDELRNEYVVLIYSIQEPSASTNEGLYITTNNEVFFGSRELFANLVLIRNKDTTLPHGPSFFHKNMKHVPVEEAAWLHGLSEKEMKKLFGSGTWTVQGQEFVCTCTPYQRIGSGFHLKESMWNYRLVHTPAEEDNNN